MQNQEIGKNGRISVVCSQKAQTAVKEKIHQSLAALRGLRGGDCRTRTSDLLRVNAGFSIFLTFFGYLELFMLRANYFPALLERGFSGCSSRVCGWLCGLRDEAEQIGGRNHPSPKEDSNTLLTKIPAVRYSTFLRSARQPTHFSRFLNLLPGVFCPLQNLHRLF